MININSISKINIQNNYHYIFKKSSGLSTGNGNGCGHDSRCFFGYLNGNGFSFSSKYSIGNYKTK